MRVIENDMIPLGIEENMALDTAGWKERIDVDDMT